MVNWMMGKNKWILLYVLFPLFAWWIEECWTFTPLTRLVNDDGIPAPGPSIYTKRTLLSEPFVKIPFFIFVRERQHGINGSFSMVFFSWNCAYLPVVMNKCSYGSHGLCMINYLKILHIKHCDVQWQTVKLPDIPLYRSRLSDHYLV